MKSKAYAERLWQKFIFIQREDVFFCADCGHTHPDNRRKQELFLCERCGHIDNADRNAAEVIKKRAIKLIMDSGTELSCKGVLQDKGRGAADKTKGAKATFASSKETSKKKDWLRKHNSGSPPLGTGSSLWHTHQSN